MYYDRKQAALELAGALRKYREQHVIVAGIPRGGIETAYYIARELQATLATIVVKKMGYPKKPEFAYAMAEDGTVYYNPSGRIHLSQEMIDEVEDKLKAEIERRKRIFRNIQLFPRIKGETVIIVDDGIATGATILAAIKMCKKKGAAKIAVASPVCSKATAAILLQEADELFILKMPKHFSSVSDFYEVFPDLSDQEALNFLEKWEGKPV